MKLFLKILFFIFTMLIAVGEAKSSTVVNLSQETTASSLFQEKQFTHCKNEFGLLDRQLSSSQVAHLKSLHSDKAIESCVQSWINPSFKNSMAFVLEGVVCQWKTPELVVAGLSAGLLGWQAMGTRSIDGAAHVVARDGMRSLPTQMHHFATIKNSRFTPEMRSIANQFGLDLNGAWNKAAMPHLGRHPNSYHKFVLKNMQDAMKAAGGNQVEFLQLYNKTVIQPVLDNPLLLRKVGWPF